MHKQINTELRVVNGQICSGHWNRDGVWVDNKPTIEGGLPYKLFSYMLTREIEVTMWVQPGVEVKKQPSWIKSYGYGNFQLNYRILKIENDHVVLIGFGENFEHVKEVNIPVVSNLTILSAEDAEKQRLEYDARQKRLDEELRQQKLKEEEFRTKIDEYAAKYALAIFQQFKRKSRHFLNKRKSRHFLNKGIRWVIHHLADQLTDMVLPETQNLRKELFERIERELGIIVKVNSFNASKKYFLERHAIKICGIGTAINGLASNWNEEKPIRKGRTVIVRKTQVDEGNDYYEIAEAENPFNGMICRKDQLDKHVLFDIFKE